MNAEEEYSESNTIFGLFSTPIPASVTEPAGSDASAILGFRGECCIINRSLFEFLMGRLDCTQPPGIER